MDTAFLESNVMPFRPKTGDRQWAVAEVNNSDLLTRLQAFRYRHYVEGLGLFQDSADHTGCLLGDVHDLTGFNYAARSGETILGSLRMNDFRATVPTVCLTQFDVLEFASNVLTEGAVVTRAIVEPKYRMSSMFTTMTLEMMRGAVSRGVRVVFIDTAIARQIGQEDSYLSMYKALGFRVWRPNRLVPGIGEGTILVIDIAEELRRNNSMISGYFPQYRI